MREESDAERMGMDIGSGTKVKVDKIADKMLAKVKTEKMPTIEHRTLSNERQGPRHHIGLWL